MEENNFYLYSNIKFLREQKKESQDDLSKIVDKGATAIGNWERGERSPDYVDIYKLAKHFDISIDDLVKKDLRFQESIQLDETHKIENVIMSNIKQLTDEEKKQIIGIIEVIKGSDNLK